MGELRVTAITIRDVLGARELALEPGRITRVEGANGSGKTTVLQAVQAALGRGSLAKLARVDPAGAETEPEVVLALEGDGEAYQVERTGDRLRVRRRVGDTAGLEDVPRPQEFLAGLFDTTAANPVRFLTAPDKDRALLLLEALPLKLDRAQLVAEMGLEARELPPLPLGLHPLEELALIRDAVFRTRTGVNRDAKGKAVAAEQTRRNAPAAIPEDLSAEVGALDSATSLQAVALARDEAQADATERQAIAEAEAAAELETERVSGAFKTWAARTRKEHEARAAEIRAEAERRIAEDLGQVEASIEARRVADEEGLDEVTRAAADVAEKARQARAAARLATEARKVELQASRERLVALRAQLDASGKAQALHQQAARFDREAEQLEARERPPHRGPRRSRRSPPPPGRGPPDPGPHDRGQDHPGAWRPLRPVEHRAARRDRRPGGDPPGQGAASSAPVRRRSRSPRRRALRRPRLPAQARGSTGLRGAGDRGRRATGGVGQVTTAMVSSRGPLRSPIRGTANRPRGGAMGPSPVAPGCG